MDYIINLDEIFLLNRFVFIILEIRKNTDNLLKIKNHYYEKSSKNCIAYGNHDVLVYHLVHYKYFRTADSGYYPEF